ncbi:helix-turn-helix domain-containing protein [Arthrobacter sp. MAHUQ-56]
MSTRLSKASTDSVDPADRLEYWEAYTNRELVGLRCSTYHPDGLRASQVNADLGAVRLAALDCSAHAVDRSMQQVQKSPKDTVLITILLQGSAFFHHAAGSRLLRAGDAIIYEASEPYLFAFDTDMRQHMLDLPRELAGATSPRPVVIPRGTDVTAASIRTLSDLTAELLTGTPRAEAVQDELLAVTSSLFQRAEPTTTVLRRAAKTMIGARVNDSDLTAESVARAVGVSSRHLNRAFAAENTTVAQYIRDQRLELARQELTNTPVNPPLIADIAARWGFSSQAHFTRAFGRRYGMAPSDMRATARAGTAPI